MVNESGELQCDETSGCRRAGGGCLVDGSRDGGLRHESDDIAFGVDERIVERLLNQECLPNPVFVIHCGFHGGQSPSRVGQRPNSKSLCASLCHGDSVCPLMTAGGTRGRGLSQTSRWLRAGGVFGRSGTDRAPCWHGCPRPTARGGLSPARPTTEVRGDILQYVSSPSHHRSSQRHIAICPRAGKRGCCYHATRRGRRGYGVDAAIPYPQRDAAGTVFASRQTGSRQEFILHCASQVK